ncbi:MAG: N-6 DNA methylase [Verrucomicrobiaceae bacterium]|nr:N-6 DNA methylase [Verrucomicrobiaceae bacterium]
MPAPQPILDLVARFGEHIDSYKSGSYNETQLRRDFLDPFFKLLGWDIDNTAGYDEAYRDVIHEDQVKVGGALKAPDYGFRIGGTRKFFLEAKKPSVRIKDDISPAYQLRRYAWSAKLPLSILSDFEEFAVYDTRIKPMPNDPASKARIFYCRFDEYAEKWDFISSTFSREAILKGSFDKFAAANKGKRGTAEVDADFLETIEGWRADLARNLALRNPDLTQRVLNFAVQRILDRIIFLRICEDRGIEDYERLKRAAEAKTVYPELVKLFQQADDRYNSGLFHFRSEKGRNEEHDTLTPHLVIDDKLLKGIVTSLYYPASPYEFSVLSADILGQVYEQFLGKVITLTTGHRAQVEDKPEVKKAGGVFYTPTYIVDYIVRQAIGPLVEGKTPKQIEKLTVLDPACGSGSFLIGAYQFLLDWYHHFYASHDPESHAKGKNPKLVAASGGGWALTTNERKRILLAHIYGVDIDSQAVEVTKLSLLLKVLEGETAQTVQRELIHERVLPDLGDNIKCGNSLIGSDFYAQSGLPEMDTEAHLRINVFDWDGKDGFPEIMKRGGFDAVVGNPPYVDIKGMPEAEVRYLFKTYPCANNRINLFAVFIERTLDLCTKKAFRHSLIVPTALLIQDSYQALRNHITSQFHIRSVVRLPNESFGASAGAVKVDTAIFVFEPSTKEQTEIEVISYSGYDRISKIDPLTAHIVTRIPHAQWASAADNVWALNVGAAEDKLIRRIENGAVPLEECAEFCLGLTPYDKYKGHTPDQIKQRVFHAESQKDETFKPLLAGNDVGRYEVHWNGKEWISYGAWLGAPREQRFFTQKRILVKQIIDWTSKRIWAAITDQELYNAQNAFNLLPRPGVSLLFLLGIINSKLITLYHRKKFLDEFKMRFQKILIKDAKRFPIRIVSLANKADQASHDRIVKLVDHMLRLHRDRASAKTPHEQTVLERQIAATDNQIDQEVYTLYGLTQEEIELVEGRLTEQAEPVAQSKDSEAISVLDAKVEYPHKGGYSGHMVFREDAVEYKTKPS